MNIFRWLEQKVFLGEVIEDYGIIQDERTGGARLRTSVLLCRRRGELQFVFRQVGTAMLGASVHYFKVDVTRETLKKLGDILLDAHKHLNEPQIT
jgi:hypothetical protein